MRFLVTAGSVLLAGAFMAKGYTQRATEAKAALEDAKRRGASAGEIRRLDRNARAAVSAGEEQLRREKANRTKNDHLSRHGVPDKDQAVN